MVKRRLLEPSSSKLALVACLIVFAWVQDCAGQTTHDDRDLSFWLSRGKAELDRSAFHDAEASLRQAIALDPNSGSAHLLLARALIGQLPLNLRLFPDSDGLLPKAEAEAKRSAEMLPKDANSSCVLGIVNAKMAIGVRDPREKARLLNAAKSSFDRALALDPNFIEAHRELARMVMDQAMWPILEARAQSGMAIGQKGPVQNAGLRHILQARYSASIEDGISHLRQVLVISPAHGPTMHELGGLVLLRATLRDDHASYSADVSAAEEWERRAVSLLPKRTTTPPVVNPNGAIISGLVNSIPEDERSGSLVVATPDAAEKRLNTKIEPDYPSAAKQAGIQGDVVLHVTIGADGHVESSRVLSGPPLLIAAAQAAVAKWVYAPLIVNGKVSKWITNVKVSFVLASK